MRDATTMAAMALMQATTNDATAIFTRNFSRFAPCGSGERTVIG